MKISKDMTKGSPLKTILLFSIPILLGNLLMQAYNLVDSIVVGHFVGTDAFGATSASNTLINFFIAILIGLGSGASIIMSQYFGRKNFDKLKQSFSTAMIALITLTVLVSILGIVFSRDIMIMLKVDVLILDDACDYLRIFFYGLVPLMIYNMYSSFLRGIGNSKIPLVFLAIATLSNIVLDLFFVAYLNMGVRGVAIATVIANVISAILIMLYTNFRVDYFAIKKKSDIYFNMALLKKIAKAGFPVIFQSFLVSLSLLLLQAIFNSYGKDYTSAYGLSSRIDAIICLPLNSIATALATYVAQNKGAKENKRIVEGYWKSMLASCIITCVCSAIMMIYVEPVISIFIAQESMETSALVIDVTKQFIYILGPCYFIMAIMFGTSNVLSGASDVKSPIIIMTVSMIIRTIIAFALKAPLGYYAGIIAFPVSWTVGAILGVIRFKKGKWKNLSFMEDELLGEPII
ncbi:MAG: MATE family efflux transporter [Clostridia bacterium]